MDYERHRPETTLLFRTLQAHWLGFAGEMEAGGGELPAFQVPARPWVLSVRCRLRFRMAYSPALTGAVLRCFIAAITSDLRRRASRHGIRGDLQTGALTVIQRFGSAHGLNVHFHSLVLDGVLAAQAGGGLLFHPLPAPSDADVARVTRAVCRKVCRMLARQPPAEDRQASLLDELANASVQGLVATGPWRGCRILRPGRPLPMIA